MRTKGSAIGRYERDEMKPSIEAAAKMAQIFDVSLDWLVGHTDMELDKKMIQRIEQVTKMNDRCIYKAKLITKCIIIKKPRNKCEA